MQSDAARPTQSSPGEATGERPGFSDRLDEWLEFIPSVLMALAVVLTAYSAYEATRWSGVQATNFATASSLRTQASSLTATGVTEVAYDANVFGEVLLAFRDADFDDPAVREEALDFADALFRDEAKPALEEWLSLNPGENPAAPATPLQVPSYKNENLDEATRLVGEAEESFQEAREANQNGDDYILATILFASVLFFTGLRIKSTRVHAMVLAFAAVCLLGGVIRLLTLPFH